MAGLNCSTLAGTALEMCNFLNIAEFSCDSSIGEYLENGTCATYTSTIQKMEGMLGEVDSQLNSGNTAFMLACSALVMIMTPGVGLFYAGLAGESSVGNTLMMSFASMCIVTFQWFLIGYSVAFGPGGPGIGSLFWFSLVPLSGLPSGAYGIGIPHLVYVIFQCMFAQITPALISGAVISRMKFLPFCLFVLAWTTLIYDPLAKWFWSWEVTPTFGSAPAGWLNARGAIDFAGGSVIHISSGWSALAAALVLGKRYNAGEKLKPHNVPMVMMGAMLLWFGWFGFNAGSAAGAASFDGTGAVYNALASIAFINTHFAACTGALSWMIVERLHTGSFTPSGVASGVVAGLVAITPGCGFVSVYASLLFGLIVSPICYGAHLLRGKIGIDDTLDSWALHGVGGMVGSFLTGLFAEASINGFNGAFYGNPDTLGANCLGIIVSASFSFFGTLILMLILKFTTGIRIDEDMEKEGIDLSEHGGKAYQNEVTTKM